MKHSPGPWILVPNRKTSYAVVHGGTRTRISKRADAYLIAAAPDLLEAAQAVMDADWDERKCYELLQLAIDKAIKG